MNKPNILWIIADQHRGQAMSCAGDTNIETPNMDALAEQGVRFSRAYSNCPLCSPFRATLFSGQYPTTHGVISNHRPLLPRQPALAELMSDAGYHTSFMGKWHASGGCFGHHFVSPWFRPGWDDWLGWENCNNHFDFKYGLGNSPGIHRCTEYQTDFLTDRTLEWLEQRTDDQPWFHVVSVEPPHSPFVAPQKYMNMFSDVELEMRPNFAHDSEKAADHESRMRGYYAQVKNIDDNVGRILQALDQHGLSDNTIVCYFSDHGEMMGSHDKVQKGFPEEESCNIPLIVRGPGIESGRTSDALIGGIDLMPTMLAMAGAATPDSAEGEDLSSLVRGETDTGNDASYIMYEHCIFPEDPERVWRNIRHGDWSYSWRLVEGPAFLYNLKDDPYELSNLIGLPEHEDIRRELEAKMRAKAAAIGDRFFARHEAYVAGEDWRYGNGLRG